MGGGGKIKYIIPDWKSYKVEDVPELMWTRKALANHGLKDPWLRNEVWKYHLYGPRVYDQRIIFPLLFRGFKYGLPLAIISTIITKMTEKPHGHHEQHEEVANH